MIKVLTVILLTIAIFGQNSFKKEVDEVYNFHPHRLQQSEQEKIFPRLDAFFEKIRSDTVKYLPLLRQELKSNDHFPYFYYDGAHLLMVLSKNKADKTISAAAFAKCNVKDVGPRMYVILLKSLAGEGIDITQAALKILDDPNFSFFVPQHAMTFSQGYCLTYCLLPLTPQMFVGSLIQSFKTTKDINAQKSIVTTLWFAYSCEGDRFLKSLNSSNTLSKDVSAYAKKILANDKVGSEYGAMLLSITPHELDEMKLSALNRFSDEAIGDLDFITKASRRNLKCR